MREHVFPKDFEIGVATASYQVEGAVNEDSRKPSIWDIFSHSDGNTYNGDTGDIACDQYHRYIEDIDLMEELGLKAYRFSIAWPRIIPNGVGEVNQNGIEYYQNLCKYLHSKGIKAVATLYHWDLPNCLQDVGGWTNRSVVDAFCKYAEICFDKLGEYVDQWITFNEPLCVSYIGYYEGEHAPGYRDLNKSLKAIHHLNLAHGRTVKIYRGKKLPAPIGITWNLFIPRPAKDDDSCRKAVEYAIDSRTRVFTSPILKGEYPKSIEDLELVFPIEPGDLEEIHQKIDFVGINYYSQSYVSYDETSPFNFKTEPAWESCSEMGWPTTPKGLLDMLRWISDESDNLPIYITENGYADNDVLTPDMRVHDVSRIEYLKKHFEIAEKALDEGIPLKGYFVWSLLDNFEWAKGYSKRFGVVYCNYENLQRIPKDSAYFIRDLIAGNGYW